MPHSKAALSFEGRRRLVRRCQHRPIAHVAAEAAVSRQCLSKWYARWREHGDEGLHDRTSRPRRSPTATPPQVVEQVIALRKRKWSARRIHLELSAQGVRIAVCTISRILVRHGLNRLRHLDVDGEPLRAPGKITARYPGHMTHLDVKKVGRIPDGGGWRVHGRGSAQAKAADRAKTRGARTGYTYLHSALDGFSRLAYTEAHDDEKAVTAIGFLFRARVFFAAHGITRFTRIVTDNGSCYRASAFTRAVHSFAAKHQRIKAFTPKHNGKVERYQQTYTHEVLYAAAYESEQQRRDQLQVWQVHYNYHRPHTAAGDQPPASRLPAGVTNLMLSYI
ncbi:IS481 family transposase [Luteipulveratus halotolerans]|uniref:Transposase n=1 Tax=Luteipulveratus halotolerans TaxID=1631356 RepID=A0A0L6CH31_9MICO|nr:IS481 family transposase [Luteipulveratus halotolerans]KNX36264.1 transposase [Luteipulveratus halotolerans]KNX37024.1 transposase [Luteipulveratus halotolerans]